MPNGQGSMLNADGSTRNAGIDIELSFSIVH
jgi:hypothetical protein